MKRRENFSHFADMHVPHLLTRRSLHIEGLLVKVKTLHPEWPPPPGTIITIHYSITCPTSKKSIARVHISQSIRAQSPTSYSVTKTVSKQHKNLWVLHSWKKDTGSLVLEQVFEMVSESVN